MEKQIFLFLLLNLFLPGLYCWNNGAVLLRDVQVLTLYKGRYTAARRTSPIPQLQCVGGTAGCGSFVPEVVQCQNKGWDGVDVQWECKADMDNWYRFGRVEVSCEGFNSPDDAYILQGSCGLEYTLELTAEGKQHQGSRGSSGSSGFAGFASSFFQDKGHSGGGYYQQGGSSGEGAGGLIVIALFLLLAYGVYKIFLCNPTHGHQGFQGGDGSTGAWSGDYSNTGPPPPGFKPDYTANSSGFDSSGPSCGSSGQGYGFSGPKYGFSDSYTRPQTAGTGFSSRQSGLGGGGFWTGMGTGGVLGYLFGSQRRQPPMGTARPSYYSTPPAPSTSSGTRTASGFGGTKRR
ncbi:store-operated calcium entry-associated regulatory factor [Astyanax mexicanus]|uniref:Store-operated calcium entry-associated regulatory factor n=1 Tax=Astyanax mexicanus TaxID=7994 RepID=A0A8B9GYV6_ASTMX|nr:store-operated calcium entry-associated regulatory factor [Astyanax mexicanus]KAG9259726.1 store-operated calcium entry-associated regulatory factor [Astyanax mexicanus]